MIKKFAAVLAGTTALACFSPASAQESPSGDGTAYFGDIVVTAEKREQNLQDVPQAISAITSDSLEANNVKDFVGLSGLAPGLTVSPAEGGDRVTISIRGVGQEANQNDVAAPSVSFHQDGVYIVSPFALGSSFLDVNHIEVVRGPQGTLFGQNSTGGAMNIITRKPELDRISGRVSGAYGSYDYRELEAELNVPVGSMLAIRGAINDLRQDGTTLNVFNGQRLDDKNQTGWRVQALFQPASNFSINLTAQHYASHVNGAARFGLLDPTPGARRLSQDDPSKTDLDTALYSGIVKLDLPAFTIKYLGSYQTAEIVRSRDNDFTSVNLVSPLVLRRSYEQAQNQYHKSWTSELNLVSSKPILGGLDWTLGAFWFKQDIEAHTFERVDQNRNGILDPFTETYNPVVFGIPPFGADVGFQSDFFPSRKSYSFYGQGTYHVGDSLRVTAGLRYTHDTAHNLNYNFFNILRDAPTADVTKTSTAVTGRFALEYDVAPGMMVFASYTRGFKPGGNNLTFGQPDVADDLVFASFKPETINAYELGFKGDLFDGRVRTNLAAFYYDYRNLQAQSTDPRNVASGVVNVPKSRVLGLEAEVQWAVTDTFSLIGTAAALDSKITSHFIALDNLAAAAAEYDLVVVQKLNQFAPAVTLARAAAAQDLKGNELAKTPKFSGTFSAQYKSELSDTATVRAALTLIYRASLQSRMFNNPAVDRVPAYAQVNASAGVDLANGISVDLIAQNLFDTNATAARFTDVFGVYSTFDQKVPPRTVIGRVTFAF
ncbi:TonB-dependent receptor [Novosphingobium album (ex Hu et al. 2023)]|uniref:TonB-dependent receptor n=1 Tax=Novosphingobium album (ex Hu et al. 2023) TaxID=2930093 RepID=A0ABT0B3Q4_9SPHN|nr:TonB-dependent receptor [Novosphingobium album (ex Hu et al. 2023)]MCJ2179680.1 TonB-dependent receptor [Novosphingobium album (ex Hu et al. 2023)]